MPESKKRIVVIGGGTGSFTILSGLKKHKHLDITALVTMADDGGSTGVLRDELGVLPPGDVRQCLVALSESSEKMRQLFNFRFPEGTFAGHSFGNIFLSAVEKMTDNFSEAVEMASEVLKIRGRVEPITLDNCRLVLERPGRAPLVGQWNIENEDFDGHARPRLYFEEEVSLNPKARMAILQADMVVIAPGNIYMSLIPAVMVPGVAECLRSTSAIKVYVSNLVNKPLQTNGFSVDDYVSEIERYVGGPVLDYVLYNIDTPDEQTLKTYALEGEFPVRINQAALDRAHYDAIGGNYLLKKHIERNPNDSFIHRSLIRHDSTSVASALVELLKS